MFTVKNCSCWIQCILDILDKPLLRTDQVQNWVKLNVLLQRSISLSQKVLQANGKALSLKSDITSLKNHWYGRIIDYCWSFLLISMLWANFISTLSLRVYTFYSGKNWILETFLILHFLCHIFSYLCLNVPLEMKTEKVSIEI